MSSADRITEMPQPVVSAATAEEEEVLHASIKAGSAAQIVVAVIAVLGLIYLLKIVMVTTLSAVLVAFVLDPVVHGLTRIKLPRPIASVIAVVLIVALVLALAYFFYSRAVDFAVELPRYSGRIRAVLAKLRYQTSQIEESTRQVVSPPKNKPQPVPVEVQEAPALSRVFSEGSGGWLDVLLAIGFVPFLTYFMLTWKDHVHNATVRMFPKEHRLLAHRTVSRISNMIRSFLLGNLTVGLVNSAVSILLFWIVGIPYFYFLGLISGFASLVPYLGLFLALLPPLAAGIGALSKTGALVVVFTVMGLHVVTMNVLYPKLVGKRLRLNPLVVTLALLFWGWIWGAMGLILAVPVMGASKIICDHVDSLRGLGDWLGE
jgi:predicted PurR-regulated permease PerM